jgi:hypothetical protein
MDIKAELYRDFYFDRFQREGQPPTYQRRGSLQLWQFLVALLDDPSNSAFIAWTGRGLEFKLIEPEEVLSLFLCVYVSLSLNLTVTFLMHIAGCAPLGLTKE